MTVSSLISVDIYNACEFSSAAGDADELAALIE